MFNAIVSGGGGSPPHLGTALPMAVGSSGSQSLHGKETEKATLA